MPLRRTGAGIAVLLTSCALSACGSFYDSDKQHVRGVSVNAPAGGHPWVKVRNLFVLGPTPPDTLPAGGSAPVYAYLTSSPPDAQTDKLVGVSSPDFTGGTIAGDAIALPSGTLVDLRQNGAPRVVLTGAKHSLRGGDHIAVTLTFARAGRVSASHVLIVARQGYYSTYSPAPSPTG